MCSYRGLEEYIGVYCLFVVGGGGDGGGVGNSSSYNYVYSLHR